MKKVLVIDGNNLAFKSFIVMHDSTGQLRNNAGVPTTVIFGVLRMISAFADSTPIDKCVVCWDGGSKYRKKIFPWYKWNRKIDGEPKWMLDYYEELKTARYYFDKLNIPQLDVRGIEGDDLVGFLTHRFVEEGDRVVIMSDDKDFYQLAKPHVKIYRPTKMKVMSDEEVIDELGYPAHVQPRVKALTGEDGDNIPGIGKLSKDHIMQKIGFGPAKALAFLQKKGGGYNTLKDALACIDHKNRFAEQIIANWKQVMVSYKLARVRTKDEMYMDWELKELNKQYAKLFIKPTVTHGMIKNISDFLDFRSINLPLTLKKIGVFK
jgi:5'-3' exonuclease